jgi:hypothetical protein
MWTLAGRQKQRNKHGTLQEGLPQQQITGQSFYLQD